MALRTTPSQRLARALHDLAIGLPVVMTGPGGPGLVAAVEGLGAALLADLRALGAPDLALSARRAATLHIPAYDGDLVRVGVPADADPVWLMASADPSRDLDHPLKGPYRARRDGDPGIHRAALALCRKAHLLPAALVVPGAGVPGASLIDAAEVLGATTPELTEVAAARVPLAVSLAGRVRVFRANDGSEEHYAVEIGSPDRALPVLARLHSACFTGDVIGSLKCDCGAQLAAALAQIAEQGAGVLLYMNQEGRGIGLANKMRAYALQDQGFDTVEANHRLGFADDERDFALGARILQAMGFDAVRLMTNNPAKVEKMQAAGLTVTQRVPLMVGQTPHNAAYLATKARKSGHLL